MTTLDVWLHGRRVADVTDDTGRLVLTWTEDLLEHVPAGSPVLSVRLAAQPATVRPPSALVRAYLGGLLPEVSTSSRSRLARRAGTSSDDVLGLLAVVGGDVAGAARFTAAGERPAVGRLEPLPDDTAVRRHLERTREAEHLGDGDSSLPGVQPKTALTLVGGRWHVPRAGAASTHILKPELPDRPSLLHDEALSSRAAQAVGLRSAVSRVVEFDGFPALVVPRFDRHVDPATGEVHRSHQEDGAAALGLTSDEIEAKFGWHRPGANLRSLAGVLGDNGGDRTELLRWATLDVLLGNTDGHAKNVAFRHLSGGRIDLAPAYDISPHAQLGRDRLALSVNGEFSLTRVGLDDLVAEARTWRVPARPARATVEDVVERFRSWLEEVDDVHPTSEPAVVWVQEHLGRLLR